MKRLFAFLLVLMVGPAIAATTPNTFVSPQTPNRGIVRFLQGTDAPGVTKTLYTAGANGSRCYGMWTTNNDGSVTHVLNIQFVNGGVGYSAVGITTIVGAGSTSAVPPQALMTPSVWPGLPVDQYGNPYIQLVSGDTLTAFYATALTASTQINVYVTCNDF